MDKGHEPGSASLAWVSSPMQRNEACPRALQWSGRVWLFAFPVGILPMAWDVDRHRCEKLGLETVRSNLEMGLPSVYLRQAMLLNPKT